MSLLKKLVIIVHAGIRILPEPYPHWVRGNSMSKSRLQRSSNLVDVEISEEALSKAITLFVSVAIRALLSQSHVSNRKGDNEHQRVSCQPAS